MAFACTAKMIKINILLNIKYLIDFALEDLNKRSIAKVKAENFILAFACSLQVYILLRNSGKNQKIINY